MPTRRLPFYWLAFLGLVAAALISPGASVAMESTGSADAARSRSRAAEVLQASPGALSANMQLTGPELDATCRAGGGQIVVSSSLSIHGGTAMLTAPCDISPQSGARIQIVDTFVDALNGDFDICGPDAVRNIPIANVTPRPFHCGTGVNIAIVRSQFRTSNAVFAGTAIYAPGIRSSLEVVNSTFIQASFDLLGIWNWSEGTTIAVGNKYPNDVLQAIHIHGGTRCSALNNTLPQARPDLNLPPVPCT